MLARTQQMAMDWARDAVAVLDGLEEAVVAGARERLEASCAAAAGAGTGSRAGSEAGARTGTGASVGAGTGSGVGPGAEAGAGTGAGSGTECEAALAETRRRVRLVRVGMEQFARLLVDRAA